MPAAPGPSLATEMPRGSRAAGSRAPRQIRRYSRRIGGKAARRQGGKAARRQGGKAARRQGGWARSQGGKPGGEAEQLPGCRDARMAGWQRRPRPGSQSASNAAPQGNWDVEGETALVCGDKARALLLLGLLGLPSALPSTVDGVALTGHEIRIWQSRGRPGLGKSGALRHGRTCCHPGALAVLCDSSITVITREKIGGMSSL